MGLMAMGASFDINKAKADSGLAVIAAVIKLCPACCNICADCRTVRL